MMILAFELSDLNTFYKMDSAEVNEKATLLSSLEVEIEQRKTTLEALQTNETLKN